MFVQSKEYFMHVEQGQGSRCILRKSQANEFCLKYVNAWYKMYQFRILCHKYFMLLYWTLRSLLYIRLFCCLSRLLRCTGPRARCRLATTTMCVYFSVRLLALFLHIRLIPISEARLEHSSLETICRKELPMARKWRGVQNIWRQALHKCSNYWVSYLMTRSKCKIHQSFFFPTSLTPAWIVCIGLSIIHKHCNTYCDSLQEAAGNNLKQPAVPHRAACRKGTYLLC